MFKYNGNIPRIILLMGFLLQSCTSLHEPGQVSSAETADAKQADTAFEGGDYSTATELYKKLLVKEPQNQDFLFHYAESLRISGSFDLAVEQYNQLIKEDENNLNAIEGRGLVYLQQGKITEALNELNSVVERDASRWRTLNAIAVAYSMNGNDEDAMKYYNLALEVGGKESSVVNNIALSLAFSGNAEKGIAMLRDALANTDEIGVNKQRLENNLALLYGISGKMGEAEKILHKNLPEAAVYNNLGFYAKIAADKKLAWSYLSKAISLSPVYYEKAENNMADLDKPSQAEAYVSHSSVDFANIAPVKVWRGKYKQPLPSLRPE